MPSQTIVHHPFNLPLIHLETVSTALPGREDNILLIMKILKMVEIILVGSTRTRNSTETHRFDCN